jgi:hypothetical protein
MTASTPASDEGHSNNNGSLLKIRYTSASNTHTSAPNTHKRKCPRRGAEKDERCLRLRHLKLYCLIIQAMPELRSDGCHIVQCLWTNPVRESGN